MVLRDLAHEPEVDFFLQSKSLSDRVEGLKRSQFFTAPQSGIFVNAINGRAGLPADGGGAQPQADVMPSSFFR
jgi:hypothetical protein